MGLDDHTHKRAAAHGAAGIGNEFLELKMIEKTVLVRGFDMFFENASWLDMQEIANDLGGKNDFDPVEQRATYMFEEERGITLDQLPYMHELVEDAGQKLAMKYSCQYRNSGLHFRLEEEGSFGARVEGKLK